MLNTLSRSCRIPVSNGSSPRTNGSAVLRDSSVCTPPYVSPMPMMPSSVTSSMIVRVVPVSMPMLQRHGASAGTVTGVATISTILTLPSWLASSQVVHPRQQSAVHHDVRAGDERGIVRREEDGHARNLLGRGD